MDTTNTIGVITIVIQLIFLEGILSIDNAAVLGALVSVLPTDKPVPYPGLLQFLQPATDRVLGMQQMAALKVGLLGAYMGRALMLMLASWVIENPILKILGAAYLVKLAFEHLSQPDQPGEEEAQQRAHAAGISFWIVVLNVELADLAFSLDNVVAAVALSDQMWVVMLGVAFGIVTMRFAAGIFTRMIRWEPILATAAYIVVLNIGVELLLAEFFHMHFEAWQKFVISAGTLILCVVYARVKFLHVLTPVFRWIGQGMGNVNELFNWVLKPVILLVKWVFILLTKPLAPLLHRPTSARPIVPQANPSPDQYHISGQSEQEISAQ